LEDFNQNDFLEAFMAQQ